MLNSSATQTAAFGEAKQSHRRQELLPSLSRLLIQIHLPLHCIFQMVNLYFRSSWLPGRLLRGAVR